MLGSILSSIESTSIGRGCRTAKGDRMLPHEIDTSFIKNNDYTNVVFGRRSVRLLDAHHTIERDEILQILQECLVSTPSALDTQPFHFLIIDSDEGKAKINDIMLTADKDRTTNCSFVLIPCADTKWFEHFDKQIEIERELEPEFMNPAVANALVGLCYQWVSQLCENNNAGLYKSIDFQAGLITMSFLYAVRAHGYEASFMDAWNPELLEDAFGFDLERYRPQGVIAVGKRASLDDGANGNYQIAVGGRATIDPERYRYPAIELTTFA